MSFYEKKEVLLSAQGVGLSFKQPEVNGKKVPDKVIFKDINFQIRDVIRPEVIQGQVVSLVGKSGIGKSMMIRMLAGLPIDGKLDGKILVNVVQTPTNPGDMGVVPQNYYLPEHLQLKQILYLAASKNKLLQQNHQIILDAITSYILEFELGDHLSKYPTQLSGGQRQRASIICQLLFGSNFLLMDEPFSGLDPLMLDKTTELLLRVSQMDEIKTIIIVSHDLRNSVAISDTVLILSNRGRASEEGATIVREVDLMQMGLAWHPEVKEMPLFLQTIRDIKSLL